MRMTYRQLFKIAQEAFSEEQWDSDLTIEDPFNEECYPAELRIATAYHDSLDENHPIIYLSKGERRATDKDIEFCINALRNKNESML